MGGFGEEPQSYKNSFQSNAKDALQWFGQYFMVFDSINEDDEYWVAKMGRPQWVSDLIDNASTVEGIGRIFVADKYRTTMIVEILQQIAEGELVSTANFVPIEESSGKFLMKWLTSHPYRVNYINHDMGYTFFNHLNVGYNKERYEILGSIISSLLTDNKERQ